MLNQGTKTKIYEKLFLSLTQARRGRRELDIILTFVLGDTSSEAGKMIELLVEEGYPWDVIAELLDEDLPAYTTSLDATLPGENVLLSAYSNKRKLWVAVHRTPAGKQISAWAATECLARRLAGLQAHISAPKQPVAEHPPETPIGPLIPSAGSKGETETNSEEEWRILF